MPRRRRIAILNLGRIAANLDHWTDRALGDAAILYADVPVGDEERYAAGRRWVRVTARMSATAIGRALRENWRIR